MRRVSTFFSHLGRAPHAGLLFGGSLAINTLALALPLMTMQIYDRVMVNHAADTLFVLSCGVLVAAAIELCLRLMRQSITSASASRFEESASAQALQSVVSAEPRASADKPAAELLQDINATSRLKDYFGGQMAATLLVDMPFAVLFLGLAFYLTGALALVTVGVLLATSLYFVRRAGQLRALTAQREEEDNNRYAYLTQALQSMHTIKALCLESVVARRYEHVQRPGGDIVYRLTRLQNEGAAVSYLSAQLMTVTIIAVGAVEVVQGYLTAGMLAAGIMLSGQLMQHLQRSLSLWQRWQDTALAAARVNSITSLPQREFYTATELGSNQGALRLSDIRFAYSGQTPLLNSLSLDVSAGEVISIFGASSSGKTTLLEVIAGLYMPDRGTVQLSGLDPARLPLERRAHYVGYLPTRTTTLHGSIMDNITGFDSRLHKEARMLAGALGIEQAVALLPTGYDTMLDSLATDAIPPGLKQRIAIARMLLRRPRVLLYDNADHGLDRDSYAAVFTLLARLKRKTTMILVSDDKNIQSLADRTFELKNGVLVPVSTAPTMLPTMREAAV